MTLDVTTNNIYYIEMMVGLTTLHILVKNEAAYADASRVQIGEYKISISLVLLIREIET